MQRRSISPPAVPCNISNEGEAIYKPVNANVVWICKGRDWTPYK